MKDLTDLDYKDLFRDAVNMMAHIARAAGFDPADPTVEPPAIVARVENLRAEVERLTAERAAILGHGVDVHLESYDRAQAPDVVAAMARAKLEELPEGQVIDLSAHTAAHKRRA